MYKNNAPPEVVPLQTAPINSAPQAGPNPQPPYGQQQVYYPVVVPQPYTSRAPVSQRNRRLLYIVVAAVCCVVVINIIVFAIRHFVLGHNRY